MDEFVPDLGLLNLDVATNSAVNEEPSLQIDFVESRPSVDLAPAAHAPKPRQRRTSQLTEMQLASVVAAVAKPLAMLLMYD